MSEGTHRVNGGGRRSLHLQIVFSAHSRDGSSALLSPYPRYGIQWLDDIIRAPMSTILYLS